VKKPNAMTKPTKICAELPGYDTIGGKKRKTTG